MQQSGEEKSQAIKVEELPSFPFATFQEFRDACRDGLCYVAVGAWATMRHFLEEACRTLRSGATKPAFSKP